MKCNIFPYLTCFKILAVLLFFCCIENTSDLWASHKQVETLLENAVLTSKKVEKIHFDGVERRKKESEQLQNILTYIKKHSEKDEKLKNGVLEKLNQDLQDFKNFKPTGEGVTCQISSNKMHLGVQGAINLLTTHFWDICDGQLPTGFSIDVPSINIFPNEEHIYSTGRGVGLKHLLVRIALYLEKSNDIKVLNKIIGGEVSESTFIHFTPLSKNFDFKPYKHSPYFIKESGKIAIIHNGYTLGAQRFEDKIESFGPNDCSSLVSLYYGLSYMTTTAEQYLAFQIGTKFHFSGLGTEVVEKWENETKPNFSKDTTVKKILTNMTPLSLSDPSEVKPGYVSVERRFPNFPKDHSVVQLGRGGHTSVVLGTIGQDNNIKLWTYGANRDIENSDMDFSYGIETRDLFGDPLVSSQKPLVMYFTEK